VVVGLEHGDLGPVGGGREPGESVRGALEPELAEEAGCRLLTYRPFAVLSCHSRALTPIGLMSRIPTTTTCTARRGGVGRPAPASRRPQRTVAVEVLAPDAAVSLLAGKVRAWEADLYRLAAKRRAGDLTPS
jgi:ADP-ribose pyrophosphatase YjhB (NUDIX family)